MDEASFIIYSNFVQHVDSMCLFILNQEFDRHTEHLINTLQSATRSASERLSYVSLELSQQALVLSMPLPRLNPHTLASTKRERHMLID